MKDLKLQLEISIERLEMMLATCENVSVRFQIQNAINELILAVIFD